MPAEEYERDFTAPGTLQEFRDLLARCSAPIVLSLTGGQSTLERDTLYEQAGLYIALHCSLLIALWDGYDGDADGNPMKVGGTTAIVHFRRENALQEGRPLPAFCRRDASILDAPGLGPLLHIPVQRAGDARAPNATPFADIGGSLEQLKMHLDVYNGDAERLGALWAKEIAKSAAELLPDADAQKHPDLADLRRRFATTDVLAVAFRNRVHRMTAWPVAPWPRRAAPATDARSSKRSVARHLPRTATGTSPTACAASRRRAAAELLQFHA
jgi:hypothetical protein